MRKERCAKNVMKVESWVNPESLSSGKCLLRKLSSAFSPQHQLANLFDYEELILSCVQILIKTRQIQRQQQRQKPGQRQRQRHKLSLLNTNRRTYLVIRNKSCLVFWDSSDRQKDKDVLPSTPSTHIWLWGTDPV